MKMNVAWIAVLLCALALPGFAKRPRAPEATSVPPPAEATEVRGEAPVLHYTFGPSAKSARVRDRSGAGNDGMAARPLRRVPGIAEGRWAARFDGASDYIRVPRSPSLEPESVTVAAWVHIPSEAQPTDAGAVAFKRNTSFHDNEDYLLAILADRRLRMVIGSPGAGQRLVTSRQSLAPDRWHHVAMTFRDGDMRLYMDGEPVGEGRFDHKLDHNPATDLLIGGRDHAVHPMDQFAWFDITDVRIWSEALDGGRIAKLYQEFADQPKVARPADNRPAAPPPRKDGESFVCGSPFLPSVEPAINVPPCVRRDDLVLHYAFDGKESGTAIPDRSGCHNDGHSFLTLEMVPGPGRTGGALHFGGPEDFVRIPRSPSLEPEAITVAAWLKLDSTRPMTKPAGTIVFKRNPSFYNNEDYHLEIRRDGTVHAICADPSGAQTKAVSPTAIAPDIWHHVAMSIGEGRIRLYVDGEPVATTPCTQPLNHNPEADLFIGAKDHIQFPMDHPCPMDLADVRIWSALLTDAEIAALYWEKARFPDVARPGADRSPEPPRVFPPWQPPEEDSLAAELRLLLEQGRRDRAASPEYLDAIQRLLDRHSVATAPAWR